MRSGVSTSAAEASECGFPTERHGRPAGSGGNRPAGKPDRRRHRRFIRVPTRVAVVSFRNRNVGFYHQDRFTAPPNSVFHTADRRISRHCCHRGWTRKYLRRRIYGFNRCPCNAGRVSLPNFREWHSDVCLRDFTVVRPRCLFPLRFGTASCPGHPVHHSIGGHSGTIGRDVSQVLRHVDMPVTSGVIEPNPPARRTFPRTVLPQSYRRAARKFRVVRDCLNGGDSSATSYLRNRRLAPRFGRQCSPGRNYAGFSGLSNHDRRPAVFAAGLRCFCRISHTAQSYGQPNHLVHLLGRRRVRYRARWRRHQWSR